jgi:hypothetical protein
MSTNQLGEKYFVEVNSDVRSGGLIAENTDLNMALNGQDITFATLALDYGGFFPGAKKFVVKLKDFRLFNPSFNFFAAKANNEFVNVRVSPMSGGSAFEFSGHIASDVTVDSADGKPTEEDLTIEGGLPNFELDDD